MWVRITKYQNAWVKYKLPEICLRFKLIISCTLALIHMVTIKEYLFLQTDSTPPPRRLKFRRLSLPFLLYSVYCTTCLSTVFNCRQSRRGEASQFKTTEGCSLFSEDIYSLGGVHGGQEFLLKAMHHPCTQLYSPSARCNVQYTMDAP